MWRGLLPRGSSAPPRASSNVSERVWKEVDGPGVNLTQRLEAEMLTVVRRLGEVTKEVTLGVVEVEWPWGR